MAERWEYCFATDGSESRWSEKSGDSSEFMFYSPAGYRYVRGCAALLFGDGWDSLTKKQKDAWEQNYRTQCSTQYAATPHPLTPFKAVVCLLLSDGWEIVPHQDWCFRRPYKG